jgi:putative ABC transport system ATP-binding protein
MTTTTTYAAHTADLVRTYGAGETLVHALKGVSVDFPHGGFTAVMGPSGSGKSTLMHCLAGLDSVTSGQVFIGDIEITALDDKALTQLRRDKVGFVFQQYNLLPTLTAIENIRLPQDIARREPDKEWLDTIVNAVGLSQRLSHRPAELSGGEQQRVACARALLGKPDARSSAEVLGFLRRSVDEFGQTIVMVTHDPAAAGYSDRVIFLSDGLVVDEMKAPTADRVLDRMKSMDMPGGAS